MYLKLDHTCDHRSLRPDGEYRVVGLLGIGRVRVRFRFRVGLELGSRVRNRVRVIVGFGVGVRCCKIIWSQLSLVTSVRVPFS